MEVSKIVSQIEEHKRLGELIDNIQQAIDDIDSFETVDPKDNNVYLSIGAISLSGYEKRDKEGRLIKHKNIYLNSGATKIIKDDFKLMLLRHLNDLKEKQRTLQV